jgi:hypothetical protein
LADTLETNWLIVGIPIWDNCGVGSSRVYEPNAEASDGWPCDDFGIGKAIPGQPFAPPKSYASYRGLRLARHSRAKPKNHAPTKRTKNKTPGGSLEKAVPSWWVCAKTQTAYARQTSRPKIGFQCLTCREENKAEKKASPRPKKKSQRNPTSMKATPVVRIVEYAMNFAPELFIRGTKHNAQDEP